MFPSGIVDRHILDPEIYFVLWSLVALIGLIRLWTARPNRRAHKIIGAALLLLGVAAAIPMVPLVLLFIRAVFFPPQADRLVLAQDQTIDGIAFQSGSIVKVMPGGILISAELQRPHSIDGLAVTGHAEFWSAHSQEGPKQTTLTLGTLVADQEIPNSGGMWCTPNRPIRMNFNPSGLRACELARPLTRDFLSLPAGSNLENGPDWAVDLPSSGDPATINGLTVPPGWSMKIQIDPVVTIASLNPTRETQSSVTIRGIPLTGHISFVEQGTKVAGELWQDATIEGEPHKKGDQVRFRY